MAFMFNKDFLITHLNMKILCTTFSSVRNIVKLSNQHILKVTATRPYRRVALCHCYGRVTLSFLWKSRTVFPMEETLIPMEESHSVFPMEESHCHSYGSHTLSFLWKSHTLSFLWQSHTLPFLWKSHHLSFLWKSNTLSLLWTSHTLSFLWRSHTLSIPMAGKAALGICEPFTTCTFRKVIQSTACTVVLLPWLSVALSTVCPC